MSLNRTSPQCRCWRCPVRRSRRHACAKSNGTQLGRPPQVTDETREAVLEARHGGKSIREIARDMKLGHGTVQRIVG